MSYSTASDIQDRIGIDRLVELADQDGDGVPDSALVVQAIADADAEIDSYLTGRYSTPVASATPLLKRLSVSIAIFLLSSRPGLRPTEDDKRRYDADRQLLTRLRDGQISLPGVSERTGTDDKTNLGVTDGAERVFGRDNLEDF